VDYEFADGKSKLFKLFFTGGIDRADPCNKLDNTQNAVMVWFRDKFAPFLAIKWVKFLVLVLFVAYLGVSTYEVLGISEGLKEERLYNDYSYMAQFVLADTKYFKRYQYRVQVTNCKQLVLSSNSFMLVFVGSHYNTIRLFPTINAGTCQRNPGISHKFIQICFAGFWRKLAHGIYELRGALRRTLRAHSCHRAAIY